MRIPLLLRCLPAVAFLFMWPTNVAHSQNSTSLAGSTLCRTDAAHRPSGDFVPEWRPPANVAHGIQAFDHSIQVVFPPTVSSIAVELWGGGGGGGGGSDDTYSEGGAGGGGGASGAYSRAVLTVTPNTEYTLLVGREGRGGDGAGETGTPATPGEAGGDSAVCAGVAVLLSAPGGAGGQAARSNARGGAGGKGRIAERVNAEMPSGLNRAGNDGTKGSLPLFEFYGRGGPGGRPIAGTVSPTGAFGGAGGVGAMTPERPGNGTPGGPGSVIISW